MDFGDGELEKKRSMREKKVTSIIWLGEKTRKRENIICDSKKKKSFSSNLSGAHGKMTKIEMIIPHFCFELYKYDFTKKINFFPLMFLFHFSQSN